jgi:hypothetical protein
MFLDASSTVTLDWNLVFTIAISLIALIVSALSALFAYTEASTFKKMYALEKQEYDLHRKELDLHEKEFNSEKERFLSKLDVNTTVVSK